MNKSKAIEMPNDMQGIQAKKPKNYKFTTDEKISLGLLLVLIILVYIIRSKFLLMPFERDEGIYAYCGKLLLEGKIPYQDFYEQKFPGIFYFYAFIISLFGDTVKGLHTGFIYINIATIITLFFTAKKLFNPIAAILTASTFAIVSLTPNLSGFTVQAEHGVVLFSSLGLLCYAYITTNKKWYVFFLMGLAMGTAFMVKTNGLFMVLWGGIMLIINFFFEKERTCKILIKHLGLYSAGVFSIIGVLFLIIFFKGAFSDMMFWTYTIPQNYVSKNTVENGLNFFIYHRDAIIKNYNLFWIHGVLAIVLCFFKFINFKIKLFAFSLALFSFMMIMPGFYFYGHYFILLLPALSILAGLTFVSIIDLLKTRLSVKNGAIKYVYLALFSIAVCLHLNDLKSYYFKPNYERILRSAYGTNPFPESMEIANWLTANSKPEDQVVLLGSEPQIYFYTKKKCPSRHAYFGALVDDIPEHKEWQREFARDVEKAKPKYFIYFYHPVSIYVAPNTDKYIFEWANKYASENYDLIGICDMIKGQHSPCLWGKQIENYKPVSQEVIYVYQRKTLSL